MFLDYIEQHLVIYFIIEPRNHLKFSCFELLIAYCQYWLVKKLSFLSFEFVSMHESICHPSCVSYFHM